MFRKAAAITAIMVMLTLPALAQRGGGGGGGRGDGGGRVRGAPWALVGAGLPTLVLVGGGYLLIRRRLRSKTD
jgi:hypothetical protein